MKVFYERSADDSLALQRVNISTLKIKVLSYLICTGIAVSLLGKLFLNISPPYNSMQLIGIIGISLVIVLIFRGASDKSIEKGRRQIAEQGSDARLFGTAEMEIGPAGITVTFHDARYDYSWKAITRIQETETHIFFYVAPGAALPLSKVSVTQGDPAIFIAQARKHWLAHRGTGTIRSEQP